MLAALLALVLAAETELRVGMDTRSRPWVFVPGLDYSAEDFSKPPRITPAQIAQLVGVDLDVLAALAARLGVTPRIVPVAWEDIEAGLVADNYDVIMNAWVPSSRTPKDIAASAPYYDWGLLVVVRSTDKLRSFTELAGKTVGHFADPSVDRSALSLRAGKLVPFEDSDQLFDALLGRRVDAVVEDSTYARWRVVRDKELRIVGDPLNRLGYHLGVLSSRSDLLRRLNAAIKELRASDELARIRTRWESADGPGAAP